MKYLLPILFLISCNSRKLIYNEKKAVEASHAMKGGGHIFFSCIVASNLDTCISHFKAEAKTPYEKNLVANSLYTMDAETSCFLHEQAYKKKQNELAFILEYAMELHRKGKYSEAIDLYEQFLKMYPDHFRVRVWLSDCYMNTGATERSLENWKLADHAKHHVEMESAIHDIYGRADLFRKRNYYREEIKKGNNIFFYDLFYLDLNWEFDWWNKGSIEPEYLNADIRLLTEKLDKKSEMYNVLDAYIRVKNPDQFQNLPDLNDIDSQKDVVSLNYNKTINEVEEEIIDIIKRSTDASDTLAPVKVKFDKAAYIKNELLTHALILNGYPLPQNGKVASDFIEICLTNSLVSEGDFFGNRGPEILKRSNETKDVDFLNLYAYLMPEKDPGLSAINKKGWTDYKDERFAWSYLMMNLLGRKLDESELDMAIRDFPGSSRIYLIKTQKAKMDNKAMAPYLTELIKKEFKTIDSGIGLGASYGIGHNSYPLKLYFEMLRRASPPKK